MICEHVRAIRDVAPDSYEGCRECLATGDTWVHLRMCLICGHVGCCDSSKNQHARRHWERTQHPIIQSFERGEDWRWCYPDEDYLDAEGAQPGV
ncbi:MAG TPA: UBP-type zinc finger domain-containing protein [Anaeromyxobacter sp.]